MLTIHKYLPMAMLGMLSGPAVSFPITMPPLTPMPRHGARKSSTAYKTTKTYSPNGARECARRRRQMGN